MEQQTPDSKLIDSMAMRYRHDFGLLDEEEKEAIRTTMKQIWEEVVGLGFYKEDKDVKQKTAVEILKKQLRSNIYHIVDNADFGLFYSLFEQAEERQKMNMELTWIEACKYAIDFIKDNNTLESKEAFDQYYKKTYN
jgi:hypothetical protein